MGETIQLSVQVQRRSAYVFVATVPERSNRQIVFPPPDQRATLLKAGQVLTLGSPETPWPVIAEVATGTTIFRVIASTRDLRVSAIEQLLSMTPRRPACSWAEDTVVITVVASPHAPSPQLIKLNPPTAVEAMPSTSFVPLTRR
jgi:hypothetical protein